MVDAYFANFPDASRERRATRLAWERLSILHDFGAHYGGCVVQIVNRSDLALDFGPEPRLPGLAYRPFDGLYKSQIRLLGKELAIPAQVLERDDLHVGIADLQPAETHFEFHPLADSERNLGSPRLGCGSLAPGRCCDGKEECRCGAHHHAHAAPPAGAARRCARRLKR